jgi:hypothetical protein
VVTSLSGRPYSEPEANHALDQPARVNARLAFVSFGLIHMMQALPWVLVALCPLLDLLGNRGHGGRGRPRP